MTNIPSHPTQTETKAPNTQEPTDDSMYRNLALMFLVGIGLIFVFFIVMLAVLAGAS